MSKTGEQQQPKMPLHNYTGSNDVMLYDSIRKHFKLTSFPSGCRHRFAEHTDQSSSESSEKGESELKPEEMVLFSCVLS